MGGPSGYRADDGAAYERFLGRWTGRLAAGLIDFAALPDDGPLLDVGCGTGSLAFELRRRLPGRSVQAVDVAAPYLAFARARAGGAGIEFTQADATHLPFTDGTFAGALAQLALNFMPDPQRAALEMRRVTRAGGVVAAAVWDFRGGLVFQRLFWDTAAALEPDAGRVRDRLFSHPLALPEGLVELWRAAGLRATLRGSLTIRMDLRASTTTGGRCWAARGPSAPMSRASRRRAGRGSRLASVRPSRPALRTARAR